MNMQCGMAKAPAGQVLASYRYLVRTLPRYSVACLWKDHTVDQAFLEDLAPGQVFTSDARAVLDAGAIKRFAGGIEGGGLRAAEAAGSTLDNVAAVAAEAKCVRRRATAGRAQPREFASIAVHRACL